MHRRLRCVRREPSLKDSGMQVWQRTKKPRQMPLRADSLRYKPQKANGHWISRQHKRSREVKHPLQAPLLRHNQDSYFPTLLATTKSAPASPMRPRGCRYGRQ